MPDENKLEAYRRQGVQVQRCCGTCVHMGFLVGSWGECKLGEYEHKKHAGGRRALPTNKFLTCNLWEGPREAGTELGKYVDLLEVKEPK